FRKRWRRQIGNDGSARVAVPVEELDRHRGSHPHADPSSPLPDEADRATVADTVAALMADRREAEARAEAAEALAGELRERVGRLEGEAAALRDQARAERERAERAEREAA